MTYNPRKTKIVCTLGPSTESAEKIRALMEDLSVGDPILLADGLVLLKAESKTADSITCKVLVGGIIHSHKGINLPSSALRVPSFAEKDLKDLAFGLQEGVDFVALSFVRHERDLEPALVAPFTDTDEIFDLAGLWALEHEIVAPGERLVVTAGAPVGTPGTTNLIKVMEIE